MSKIFFSRKHSIGKETKNGDVVFNIKINDTDEIKLPYTLNGKVSYLNEFYEDLDDVVSGESTKLNFEFAIQTTSKTTAINKTEFTDSFYEYYRLKRIGLHNENRKNFLTLVVLGIFAIILFILLGVLDYFIIENSDDTVVTSIKLTCEIFWDFFMVLAWVIAWKFFELFIFNNIVLSKKLQRNNQFLHSRITFIS